MDGPYSLVSYFLKLGIYDCELNVFVCVFEI